MGHGEVSLGEKVPTATARVSTEKLAVCSLDRGVDSNLVCQNVQGIVLGCSILYFDNLKLPFQFDPNCFHRYIP